MDLAERLFADVGQLAAGFQRAGVKASRLHVRVHGGAALCSQDRVLPCRPKLACLEIVQRKRIRRLLGIALATSARNTLATDTNERLLTLNLQGLKHWRALQVPFGAQFANIINHPQFIPGSNPGQGLGVNDVNSFTTGPNSSSYINYLKPNSPTFNNPRSVFASNARSIALVAKFTF